MFDSLFYFMSNSICLPVKNNIFPVLCYIKFKVNITIDILLSILVYMYFKYKYIHSFIHPSILQVSLEDRFKASSQNLSQLTWGKRLVRPWTGQQSITGLTQTQASMHAHTWLWPNLNNLIRLFVLVDLCVHALF